MKKPKVKPTGDMALLLHVHSILSYSGHLGSSEIADRLHMREVDFSVEQLHKMLHSEAAGYFGIRVRAGQEFYALQFTSTVQSQPVVMRMVHTPKPTPPSPPKVDKRLSGEMAEAKRMKRIAVMNFLSYNGRLPDRDVKGEAWMFNFINNHRSDAELQATAKKYRAKPGRPKSYDDEKLGMQLAESGGGGSF